MSFKTLDELLKRFPWRSQNKFVPLAKRYGSNEQEAKPFLNNKVEHNAKVPKVEFIQIVSKHPGGYQKGTFINDKQKGGCIYSMLININTRKAYAYPLIGTGLKSVIEALTKFFNDVKECIH